LLPHRARRVGGTLRTRLLVGLGVQAQAICVLERLPALIESRADAALGFCKRPKTILLGAAGFLEAHHDLFQKPRASAFPKRTVSGVPLVT
jgi:hypothetical protein